MKNRSRIRRTLTSFTRRNVSVVQLKLAARTALVIALAGISLAAVMHHRPAFWIMTNGHQEPRDLFAATPKATSTTGLAGTFTTFEAPYAGMTALTGTGALAMNASGEITGVYSNEVGVFHGFFRTSDGTITVFDVGDAGSVKNASQGTIPVSINANGDIAGTYIDPNLVQHGFLRTAGGTITVFDAPGALGTAKHGTAAMSINDSGEVAGFYLGTGYVWYSFIRNSNGAVTTITAPNAQGSTQAFGINAAGYVTGSYTGYTNGIFKRHGFELTAGGEYVEFDPPGGGYGSVYAGQFGGLENGTLSLSIDEAGDLTGTYSDSKNIRHGFLYAANGTITTFDPPGVGTGASLVQGTLPFSISPSGNAITGLYSDATGVYHGFLRNTATAAISTFDVPGAGTAGSSAFPGTAPFSVNDAGNLAGVYTDSKGVAHGFLFTPTVPAVVTPTFSPAAGTYTSAQTVNLSEKTTGAAIYYTLDGSTPTSQSSKYSTPLTVSKTTTIHAIAEATGYANSGVASATYTINLPVTASPAFSPAVGAYSTIQTVTLTDATKGAAIYYTLTGATPTTGSTLYTKPLTVSQTTTIKAFAAASGYADSVVASALYTINLPVAATPTVSPAAGAYGETQLVTLSSTTPGATIYYTTNTTVPTTASTLYTGPITIGATETLKAIAVATGFANSPAAIAAYNVAGSPQVLTGLASSVTASNGILSATVSTGAQGQAWFVWGTSKTALEKSTARTNVAASATAQTIDATITGLTANTTYYFQPVATSAGGTTYGAIQSFTTP